MIDPKVYREMGLSDSEYTLIVETLCVITATLKGFDTNLERAAMSSGANPFRTFLPVTLPVLRPGMLVGALFAWWSAPFIVSRISTSDNPARLVLPADWRVESKSARGIRRISVARLLVGRINK